MFGFKKKKSGPTTELTAPVNGNLISLSKVQDAVFSGGAMGKGLGIEPVSGKISAPVAGEISMIAETKHALGIKTADGLDVLLHLGVDTVGLNGKPFEVYVKKGQQVKAGQKLMAMDLAAVKAAGLPTTVILVITNSADQAIELQPIAEQQVSVGQSVATLIHEKE